DFHVTGVQTCALPISVSRVLAAISRPQKPPLLVFVSSFPFWSLHLLDKAINPPRFNVSRYDIKTLLLIIVNVRCYMEHFIPCPYMWVPSFLSVRFCP